MDLVLVSGATVRVELSQPNTFSGWPGIVTLDSSQDRLKVDGKSVVLEGDLTRCLERMLVGKAYICPPFVTVPGSVSRVKVMLEHQTLSEVLTVDGEKATLETTKGRLEVSCVPAQFIPPPPASPTQDQSTTKVGQFTVTDTGQIRMKA